MKQSFILKFIFTGYLFFSISTAYAEADSKTLNLPFPFYSEHFGASVGYIRGTIGYPQPQSLALISLMAGSKGSIMGFGLLQDYHPFNNVNRLFLDSVVSVGYFENNDAYINGNPNFPNERAGSNDSSKNNYISGDGIDSFFRFKFKYLLPIGHGREVINPKYKLKDGLLVDGTSGSAYFNPFKSGRTFIQAQPFYRSQNIDVDNIVSALNTNGINFSLFWDNRDFPSNPSKGNGLHLKFSRDFGWFDSDSSWTSIDVEYDHYIDLGKTKKFRQRTLALDVWASYSPTWNTDNNGDIKNRPPSFTGATLGGLLRMRAYPSQRFNDKAAIYYSAELRLTPEWNPFDKWQWLQKHVGVKWIQFSPFIEVGRVAPSWDLSELHEDMKYSAGIGIRAMAKGFTIRFDNAVSEEGYGAQMMIGHSFQF